MNRTLRAIALGLAGLVAALVLTVAAFAIAGQRIAQPAGVPIFTTTATRSPGPDDERGEGPSSNHHSTQSLSPSVDDQGGGPGASTSEGSSGSDDGGGSEGHGSSGTGSSSGNEGNGSNDSGSGSGSGSDSDSGDDSGSGEHGDD